MDIGAVIRRRLTRSDGRGIIGVRQDYTESASSLPEFILGVRKRSDITQIDTVI
jgi:hypothetical protein